MNLATVIELSSAALGLFSGVFFCVGVLHIKDSTIEVIATSHFGSGHAVAKELAQQKAEFIFGAAFLFLSFFVQVVGKCLPSDVALFVVATTTLSGVGVGLGVPGVLLALLYIPYRLHCENTAKKLATAVEGKV
ncbi:hypothetical protein [Rhodoferax sp. U11-2br]|uniref:hypothetical protein n=1 Tax=Rhodoferax sp. U11-2br TaxID=2838878 RepID=UPI001BE631B8|nr:hypothetical protein [Rhodoferax sp. U11-2br]MBT3067872.1 hypothetical protein [Rhodoferax sp. U11-2br]